MKKIIVLFIVVVMGVFISCQKDYVCYCTKPNTNVSSYRETYKGTVFAKKAATKYNYHEQFINWHWFEFDMTVSCMFSRK